MKALHRQRDPHVTATQDRAVEVAVLKHQLDVAVVQVVGQVLGHGLTGRAVPALDLTIIDSVQKQHDLGHVCVVVGAARLEVDGAEGF